MRSVDRARAVEGLDGAYGAVDDLVAGLTSDEFLAPSGCLGWTVADLLFHCLLDAQRALVTFHSPAAGPPDTDHVAYWRAFRSNDETARAHARFVRVVAAAHRDPAVIASRWHETAAAARRASRACNAAFVTTQRHCLATPAFIATLVVEAAVHHLDLIAHLEGKPLPAPAAASLAAETVDTLLGTTRPREWDVETYLRKATGRVALTDEDQAALGPAAAKIPVFS